MSDDLDRSGAADFAITCAGHVSDHQTPYDHVKDRLIQKGEPKAIATLALVCAELNGADFDDMMVEARGLFDKEFDAERSWAWRRMLASGVVRLDTRGDQIEVHCDDKESCDRLRGDLDGCRINHTVEPDPDDPESSSVRIERGFLAPPTA